MNKYLFTVLTLIASAIDCIEFYWILKNKVKFNKNLGRKKKNACSNKHSK